MRNGAAMFAALRRCRFSMMRSLNKLRSGRGLGAQLVKAIVGSAGLRIIGMVFGFLVGVQLARGLGPAGYGVYGTAVAIITVLMIPTELGLPQLVMREVAAAIARDGVGSTSAIVGWARRFVLVSSLAIASVALLVLSSGIFSVSDGVRGVLIVGLLWIPIVALGNIHGAALRGMRRVVSGQIGEILVRPLVVSSLLFLSSFTLTRELSPSWAMGINVFAASAGAAFSVVMQRRAVSGTEPRSGTLPPGLSFGESLPIAMTEGMRVLAGQVSVLVLAAMASKHDVGLYRVANGIYIASTMPSALVNVACAPTISWLFTQGRLRDLARVSVASSIFLTGAAAAFVGMALIGGKFAVSTLFGAQYSEAANVLLIFFVGELVASFFGYPTMVLNMMRQQAVVMWWSGAGLLVNLIASVILVKHFGYEGAAVGSVAGLTTWRAGCAIYAKRHLGLDACLLMKLVPRRSATKPEIAA